MTKFVSTKQLAEDIGTSARGLSNFFKQQKKYRVFTVEGVHYVTEKTADFLRINYGRLKDESLKTLKKTSYLKYRAKLKRREEEKEDAAKDVLDHIAPMLQADQIKVTKELTQQLVALQTTIREASYFMELLAGALTKVKQEAPNE
jgi:hypothetical protein